MEVIGTTRLWSILSASNTARKATNYEVRNDRGHRVTSYLELASAIAELQYLNRDHVFLYRGQSQDHQTIKNNTTIKPGIFRSQGGLRGSPDMTTIRDRYRRLNFAEDQLSARYYNRTGRTRDHMLRQRILRWSILQHYEVCQTPLLDVTQSLRVAVSFAALKKTEVGFVYVFGVPNISGAITASAEAGLQIIRLSSVCPPAAVRPHIQEGFLLGEYPEMSDPDQKSLYRPYEIDFALRLVAKFRFEPNKFIANRHFPMISKAALYPSKKDDLFLPGMEEIKRIIN